MGDDLFIISGIAAAMLIGCYVLKRFSTRRAKRVKNAEPDPKLNEVWEKTKHLLKLLEQQKREARAWILDAHQEERGDYVRFFDLVDKGNTLEIERICDALNRSLPSFEADTDNLERLDTKDASARMREQQQEMVQQCSQIKSLLRKMRKFSAYRVFSQFHDFLETREYALRALESTGIATGDVLYQCSVCGSIFTGRPPAFCLGCATMNIEFERYHIGACQSQIDITPSQRAL